MDFILSRIRPFVFKYLNLNFSVLYILSTKNSLVFLNLCYNTHRTILGGKVMNLRNIRRSIAAVAASKANLDDFRKYMTVQTIGHDKLNQLRHVRFFKDINGLHEHMRKHADILRPKFELVLATLDKELNGLGIGEWTKPHGGYFISFDAMEGCAKAIVAKAKEAGVVMTGAGATYPYGKDPKDSNIRIAPSYPSVEELGKAAEVFVLCVKLVSVEKLLEK